MSAARFFAPDAVAGAAAVTLPAEEAHHLRHVLRIGPESEVLIFNGLGDEWLGRVVSLGKGRAVSIALLRQVVPAAEPPVRVAVAIGVLKGDQMDVVVRDATMLGAASILPVTSAHVSAPPPAWKTGAAAKRWRRLAVASAKQCGRAVLPDIRPVQPLETVIDAASGTRLMCVEPGAGNPPVTDLKTLPRPSTALLLIGPEGGWAGSEIQSAVQRGVNLVNLGPRTLRAETVPAVLLAALWTVGGWSA